MGVHIENLQRTTPNYPLQVWSCDLLLYDGNNRTDTVWNPEEEDGFPLGFECMNIFATRVYHGASGSLDHVPVMRKVSNTEYRFDIFTRSTWVQAGESVSLPSSRAAALRMHCFLAVRLKTGVS